MAHFHVSWQGLFALILVMAVQLTAQIDPRNALTPPMGWNSWNQFMCGVTEDLIRDQATAIVNLGLHKMGYQYINIDDCWQALTRDENGDLQADPEKFPSGIKGLADWLHSMGLKLGIYSDVGTATCQGFPGSYGEWDRDARTFEAWGVDYLKFDTCHLTSDESSNPAPEYTLMSEALGKLERPIVYSICNWGMHNTSSWAPAIANSWRTTRDIFPKWSRVMTILDVTADLWKVAKSGHWNDPDMLEVGVKGHIFNNIHSPKTTLTEREAQSHFSLWCLLTGPLILGMDLTKSPDWAVAIINNTEAIAINQDKLGNQARLIRNYHHGICVTVIGHCIHTQTYAKNMTGGTIAVGLLNRAGGETQYSGSYTPENITITWEELGIPEGQQMLVRDVWAKKDVGVYEKSFTAIEVDPHGMALVVLTPQQPSNVLKV